jgi:hypothetical protein
MAAARGAALATAVRVVDRVHGHAAVVRALAEPAVAAGLADLLFMWSGFDTAPTVAKHWPWTMRCSPEFRRTVT